MAFNPESETSALDFVREDTVRKIRALYARPSNVKDEEAAKEWLEALARAIVTTTRNRAYILQGWNNLVRTYRGKEWPPIGAICNSIEKALPKEAQRSEKTLANPSGKTAKGCADYLKANLQRVIDEWWMLNSTWVEDLFREIGLDEDRAKRARASIRTVVESAANYHTQALYWELVSTALDLEADLDIKTKYGDHMAWQKLKLNAAVIAIRRMAERGWPSPFGPATQDKTVLPAFSNRNAMAKIMGNNAAPSAEPQEN